MYSLLSFWLLLATFSFLRGRNGNWKWWILFAAASALAQYTHNLAAVYLIPLAVTPLIQKKWRIFKSVVVASIVSILLYLPWLIQLPAQFAKVQSTYWVERPGIEKLFTLVDSAKVYAVAYVPENMIRDFEKGKEAAFSQPSGKQFLGRVERIEPIIDPKTDTQKVYVLIDNSQGNLGVGMSGSLESVK